MNSVSRETVAYISPSAIQRNVSLVKQMAPNSRVMAVVKADAYGLGLEHVLPALGEVDALAVASMPEAMTVRSMEPERPIIVLQGVRSPEELREAANHHFTVVVHQLEQIAWLEQVSGSWAPARLLVWLKLNTGMNRLGVRRQEAAACWGRLHRLASVEPVGVMTHFACADDARSSMTVEQIRQFDDSVQALRPLPAAASLANSAAIMTVPQSHRQWVRPGIMLYGGSPDGSEHIEQSVREKPSLAVAMTLVSRVIALQKVCAGDAVGYGATHRFTSDGLIAVVAAGYGDGYPRHVGLHQSVAIRGQLCPLVGRVSMDMLTVDVSQLPEVAIGDAVELWGPQVSIDQLAANAGTISYELFCQVTARVKRVVVD